MTAQLLIGLSALGELSVILVWLSMSLAAVELVAGGTMVPSVLRGVAEIVVSIAWFVLTVAFGALAYILRRFWEDDDDD